MGLKSWNGSSCRVSVTESLDHLVRGNNVKPHVLCYNSVLGLTHCCGKKLEVKRVNEVCNLSSTILSIWVSLCNFIQSCEILRLRFSVIRPSVVIGSWLCHVYITWIFRDHNWKLVLKKNTDQWTLCDIIEEFKIWIEKSQLLVLWELIVLWLFSFIKWYVDGVSFLVGRTHLSAFVSGFQGFRRIFLFVRLEVCVLPKVEVLHWWPASSCCWQ